MAETGLWDRRQPGDPLVYSIPTHRSFADTLAHGLIRAYGHDRLGLARGRIILPTNRAVRAVMDAFVRASGGGLLLPRLIPIGDSELDERIGGALDPIDDSEGLPPAIDPLERQLSLARLLRQEGEGTAEAMRLAEDLARTIDALTVEEIPPARLSEAVDATPDLAAHWQAALARFQGLVERWPGLLEARGQMDLAARRNHLLRSLADRWATSPPDGFTLAAGITTSAPAVAALLSRIARLERGALLLPGLPGPRSLPDEEWEALGPDEDGNAEQSHPAFHLKRLLDQIGVARGDVREWPGHGRASSSAARGRAVVNAMVAARFSDKWTRLAPPDRRLTGIRVAEFGDPASEAQGIAIALREALDTPGQTAALVTPDRALAKRVSAHLRRWDIEADDSAGLILSTTPAGTLLLAIASAIVDDLAPVSLLALLKHPLVGGEGEERRLWLDAVRTLDLSLRGPRPPGGPNGLDDHLAAAKASGTTKAWQLVRPLVEPLAAAGGNTLAQWASTLRTLTDTLCGNSAWRAVDGRAAAEWLSSIEAQADAAVLPLAPEEVVPVLRRMLDSVSLRRPYGGHPRIFIWGLLEARLQQADLMILGGLNEGVWPSLPTPDPWLPPRVRQILGVPGLDMRSGLAAHDFMSALGAPRVLLTRARRDGRSPTVASRLWLRLQAMTGGVTRDRRLERLSQALDSSTELRPVGRPRPCPPIDARPKRIAVTDLDRLNADPFAFYARSILKLSAKDPVDANQHAAWKGTAVHEVLERWFRDEKADPARLPALAEAMLAHEAIHPMLRALWSPRLMEAIRWIADEAATDWNAGRTPLVAEARGEADVAGVTLYGVADRIDRMPDGTLAIVDYKTGQAPSPKAVNEGFALQLGLLSLIAKYGSFAGLSGKVSTHEYWSLAKKNSRFGYRRSPDAADGAAAFIDRAYAQFGDAADKYLLGDEPFVAKLNPAYAPYGDYDQLMRLEEWYGRD
ncbi:double-strand break repair protein AddB [Sphingomonas sp. LY160]|uniref:double-strand break repair protein AddB n=1 Tax=Sphingomonas sp. LY160 TaxID=3095342 RepID=UPI002ADEAF28|nr:double-strand break repair protein AddB [Sphingomonas sp. LY160]MEA1071239.1 double-strand break repair protein AddB [Sphingomonas sp. LY160]